MKAKFVKGTTWRGKLVNGGDILDLDEKDYHNFVKVWKDAVPYTEPVVEEAKAEPAAAATPEPETKKERKLRV